LELSAEEAAKKTMYQLAAAQEADDVTVRLLIEKRPRSKRLRPSSSATIANPRHCVYNCM